MILERINEPQDIKNLTYDEMQILAGEIREFLISTISQTGGHLASNLGVVELTIALYRVFDLPGSSSLRIRSVLSLKILSCPDR